MTRATRATSKKNLGAEKRVYSSIHVLSWAPKLHPVPSACARALVLTPDSYRGVGATCPHKLLSVKTVVCSVFLTPAPGHQFHQRSTGLYDKDKILTVVASQAPIYLHALIVDGKEPGSAYCEMLLNGVPGESRSMKHGEDASMEVAEEREDERREEP